MTEEDGIEFARHLRALAQTGKLVSLSVVRDPHGDWQGNMQVDRNAFNVDVRSDPLDALLVASGAVPVLEMNRRRGGNPLRRYADESPDLPHKTRLVVAGKSVLPPETETFDDDILALL